MWRTAEGASADEGRGAADVDAGDVGVLVGVAAEDSGDVTGEGLLDDGVEVGVAAAKEETGFGLVGEFTFEALSAVGLGVELGTVEVLVVGGSDAEVLLDVVGGDVFDLVGELVVEVAEFEDELVAVEVLVDADVVGLGALGAEGFDVVGRDVCGVAGEEELGVEGAELDGEGGFLHALRVVEADAGAVEGAAGGTDGDVGEADAGLAGDAVEMVLLDGAAEGVEEAVPDVALDLGVVFEVGALGLFKAEVGGDVGGAALVFVTEAEEGGDAMGEDVVALVVELVAVGVLVAVGTGVDLGAVGGGVAVGSADGDDVAEVAAVGAAGVVGVGEGEEGAGLAEVGGLLALAGDAVAGEVMPVGPGAVFDGEATVEVLVGFAAVLGEAVEVEGSGEAFDGVGVAEGGADAGVEGKDVAEVEDAGGGVIAVELEVVGGVGAGDAGEVVEALEGAAQGGLVAPGVEAAGVAGVVKAWGERGAAGGGDVDDAGLGVCAVEGAVGAAVDFDGSDAGAGDGAVVEGATDVFGGDAVDEDLVAVGWAAAKEEAGDAAELAGLDEEDAGGLAELVDDADAEGEGFLREDADGSGELGQGRGEAGGGDGDFLLDGVGGEDDVLVEDVGFAAVEVGADGGEEAGGGAEEGEAAGVAGAELEGAVGAGVGHGDDLAGLDEANLAAGEGLTEGVGDVAAHDDGFGKDGGEAPEDEGEGDAPCEVRGTGRGVAAGVAKGQGHGYFSSASPTEAWQA